MRSALSHSYAPGTGEASALTSLVMSFASWQSAAAR
jgi:hypothetical protein